jgi:DNA-binding CsgD family transcriptional regulator
MNSIEFYRTPQGDVMVHDQEGIRIMKETDRKFISEMLSKIQEFYPESVASLSKLFDKKRFNIPHFEFCIVRRFIKCNWGKFDSLLDIDQVGNFNFEEVDCPLRGECALEGIVCRPKFNSKLSERELEIMNLFYDNMAAEEIADRICLSVETVKTHKRNAFKRVKVHSISEFFIYAKDNNLFDN